MSLVVELSAHQLVGKRVTTQKIRVFAQTDQCTTHQRVTPENALAVRVVAAPDSFDMLALMFDLEQIYRQVSALGGSS